MSLFAATIEALIILFLVGTVGFLAVKRGLIARDVLTALSRVALEIALPALIFTNLITQEMPDNGAPAWTLPLWWTGFMAVVAGMAYIISIPVPKNVRREFRAALIYPNAVFIPLLLIGTKYGQNSPEVAMLFVFNLFFSPYYFTTYPLYFGNRTLSNIRWSRVIHPVLIVTLLALTIRICGLRETIPSPILQGTELLGKAALPLILLILGGQLTANAKKAKQITAPGF